MTKNYVDEFVAHLPPGALENLRAMLFNISQFDHPAFRDWMDAAERSKTARLTATRVPPAAIYRHIDHGLVVVEAYGADGRIQAVDVAGRKCWVMPTDLLDVTADVKRRLLGKVS